jgi:hypothetical protein
MRVVGVREGWKFRTDPRPPFDLLPQVGDKVLPPRSQMVYQFFRVARFAVGLPVTKKQEFQASSHKTSEDWQVESQDRPSPS